MGKVLSRIIKLILGVIILFFIINKLIDSYNPIKEYSFNFNFIYLVLSFIFGMVGFLCLANGWRICLDICGQKLNLKKSIEIWVYSQMPKYLPGTVWYFFTRVRDCKKEGINERDTVISCLLEIIMLGASALILAGILISKEVIKYIPGYIFIPSLIIGVLALHPNVLNWFIKRFKKGVKLINVKYSTILLTLVYYIFCWLLFGVGFIFLAMSIEQTSMVNMGFIAGSFLLGWVMGFISIFAPGGIGVREGVIYLLLANIFSTPVAIVIAFVSRIWWIAIEVILFIGAMLISNKKIIRIIKNEK